MWMSWPIQDTLCHIGMFWHAQVGGLNKQKICSPSFSHMLTRYLIQDFTLTNLSHPRLQTHGPYCLLCFHCPASPRTRHHEYLEHLDHLDDGRHLVASVLLRRLDPELQASQEMEMPAAPLVLQTRRQCTHAHRPNLSSPTLASPSHSPLLLSQLLHWSRISHLPHSSIPHSSFRASLSFFPPSPRERHTARHCRPVRPAKPAACTHTHSRAHMPVTSSASSPSLCHVCWVSVPCWLRCNQGESKDIRHREVKCGRTASTAHPNGTDIKPDGHKREKYSAQRQRLKDVPRCRQDFHYISLKKKSLQNPGTMSRKKLTSCLRKKQH